MVEGIEALLALERTGTISEAAAQLRLTQSAVSKRIQSLENELKFKLIEPDGRRVKLTAKGLLFLNKASPLFSELKNLKYLDTDYEIKKFSIAISDSIAASWGPKLIRLASKKLKSTEFEIHVHRSTLVEENIKLGKYHLGLCISNSKDPQIISSVVFEEPLVLLRCPLESNKLITIEKSSGTWRSLEEKISRHPKLKNFEFSFVESFAAIIQMVKEGYGHGLVPMGIAQTMQISKKDILMLSPNIRRQIKLISRKNIAQLPAIEEFEKLIKGLAHEL
ncbi:MAG: LysR family transcriptional regulator [Bdellovibrionota bacterium]